MKCVRKQSTLSLNIIGWYLAECWWDLGEWLERLTANAEVATVPVFNPSVLQHSGFWEAADEAVLNTEHTVEKNLNNSPCLNINHWMTWNGLRTHKKQKQRRKCKEPEQDKEVKPEVKHWLERKEWKIKERGEQKKEEKRGRRGEREWYVEIKYICCREERYDDWGKGSVLRQRCLRGNREVGSFSMHWVRRGDRVL